MPFTINNFKSEYEIGINLSEEVLRKYYIKIYYRAVNLQKYIHTIKRAATRNKIDPNLLLGIISIESANRNGVSFIENLLVKVFPYLVVKLDISIGISQLKVSTILRELDLKTTKMFLVKNLINPTFNICLCGKLLKHYSKQEHNDKNKFDHVLSLVKLYTTGKNNGENYPWIILYSIILMKILQDNLFDKLYETYVKSN